MNNNFKYKTDLEIVIEDLYWINRNINFRYILDSYLKEEIHWSKIPQKLKFLNEYYNYRSSKLIGGILRLSSFQRSKVTEEFPNILKEVKELIAPAIVNNISHTYI